MTLKNGTHADRSSLGLRERVAIVDYLKDKLTRLPGGYVAYVEPHSDRTVADDMAFACSEGNVAGARIEMYGRLRDSRFGSNADLVARVEALETQAATFERAVEDLYDRLSQVRAEVRHEPAPRFRLRLAPQGFPGYLHCSGVTRCTYKVG